MHLNTVVTDKEDSLLELAIPVPVKAMDAFRQIKKKICLNLNLKVGKCYKVLPEKLIIPIANYVL